MKTKLMRQSRDWINSRESNVFAVAGQESSCRSQVRMTFSTLVSDDETKASTYDSCFNFITLNLLLLASKHYNFNNQQMILLYY